MVSEDDDVASLYEFDYIIRNKYFGKAEKIL